MQTYWSLFITLTGKDKKKTQHGRKEPQLKSIVVSHCSASILLAGNVRALPDSNNNNY